MDRRAALNAGTVLSFPGMDCVVEAVMGRGSNAIVYRASYRDAATARHRHRVLVKELFPYDPAGHIWRDEDLRVRHDEQGEALWNLHLTSFQRGNDFHLRLLSQWPAEIGGNLNTFALNGTWYTLLSDTGSRSLEAALGGKPADTLRRAATWTLRLLDSLEIFHDQGCLHLDVSLDNLLLIGSGEQERVMLIDYNSVHTREEMLGDGPVCLSAKEGFASPEVQTGMRRAISFPADLFSATAVFYACLTGKPPTMLQLNRKTPPDAQDSPLLPGAPATVQSQARRILRRGLCVLADRRYQSCGEMRQDLRELVNRLDGVGVTHAALWEAGRRSVQRLVRQNPSLAYIERDAELYPLRVIAPDGAAMPAEDFMRRLAREEGKPILLEGEGGAGKSTALLRAALAANEGYSPAEPAALYLSLAGWNQDSPHALQDQMLRELRFDASTRTMEDARHALTALLGAPLATRGGPRAAALLLLDGLNEVSADTSGLIAEINALAALPGLRVVVASRTEPEGLPAQRVRLARLDTEDVQQALSRHGLLMPEGERMRALLQTPMMLSLFIQTAQARGSQPAFADGQALLDGYLDALCEKVDAGERYQVEAAVRLVLPAIARRIQRQGHPLDDRALLETVLRCRSLLTQRTLARAFPEWLGHGAEILGGLDGEAWYGRVVQQILWKKLGLLIRDESGAYRVLHQILMDHLVLRHAENARRIRRARLRTGAIVACGAALVALAMLLAYEVWLKPKPYDDAMSASVLESATSQYVCCGMQYDAMMSLLDGSLSAEACANEVTQWGLPVERSVRLTLDAMRDSPGAVIPWSGAAFDFESCEALLALPAARAEEYPPYIRAYGRLLERGTEEERDAFARSLSELVEARADAAWVLNQMACVPHMNGLSEARRLAFDTGLLSLPAGQESRSVDLSRGLAYALDKAEERARVARAALDQMPVMYEAEDGT